MPAVRLACGRRPQGRFGGECGGESFEEDVEAAFEFGSAVVGREDRGEAAQQGELGDGQPVQAQPQQVVGLVGVLDEFLELVQEVAVQETEQGPVDVQRIGSAEPGPGEQRQDVLEGAQGTWGAQAEGSGQRPGDDQRDDVRVREGEAAVARATARSCPAQSGSAESTWSWARMISATPSSSAALFGACRYKIIGSRSRARARRRMDRARRRLGR